MPYSDADLKRQPQSRLPVEIKHVPSSTSVLQEIGRTMNTFIRAFIVISVIVASFTAVLTDAEAATLRGSAMASANTQKGAKYTYGAKGGYSKGYDCSGLVYWAYKKHGKTLPRTAQAQYNKSKKVSAKKRKPGDLIFIMDKKGRVYHVGIFTGVRKGKGYILNANTGSYRGKKVVEAPIKEYTAGSPRAVYGRY